MDALITILAYLTVFGLPILGVIGIIYFGKKLLSSKVEDQVVEFDYAKTAYEFVKGQYSLLGFPWERVKFDLHLQVQVNREDAPKPLDDLRVEIDS